MWHDTLISIEKQRKLTTTGDYVGDLAKPPVLG